MTWSAPPLRKRPMVSLPLKAGPLTVFLGAGTLATVPVQLALGASPAVLAAAVLAIVFGLLSFAVLGPYSLGAWVALFFTLGNVLVALYGKTVLGQPMDSNLYAPLDSFLALVAVNIGLGVALFLSRKLPMGRPILQAPRGPGSLGFLSWTCVGLGVLFWLLNREFQDPGGSGFGGVTLFRDLLFMAVIARTAMLLERSDQRRSFDGWLAAIIVLGAFLGLVDNSKTVAALPVVSYFVTVMFYRRGLPVRLLVVLAVGVVVFVSVIAPMIHALRATGQQELSIRERVDLVVSTAVEVVRDPDELNRLDRIASGQFANGYYDYFGGDGVGQMLLGRYASVQQIDPVIAEVNSSEPVGGSAVWPALTRLLPSVVYPDKPQYTEAYETLVHYGLINPLGGKFPTLPLAGQAYAAYGVGGLLVIPLMAFLLFLLVAKKLTGDLEGNVYAIFFFCSFVVVYASQGDFGQYVGAALRNLPLLALVFLAIEKAYLMRLHHLPSPQLLRRPPTIPASQFHEPGGRP